MNQLEIKNQSVLRMFIIALHLCFVYEPYEGLSVFQNFSVVSVLAFILPTPGRGVVKITKGHKKISCLIGHNTEFERNAGTRKDGLTTSRDVA
jgi:hypothetical protein